MANRIKESNITPGAVTSDKIAPGTVSASNISPGTITTDKIAPGTIANDRLANTGITINGTTIALGASGTIVAGTDWQSVVTADGSTATTASAGEGYFIDTTSAVHTVTLPSSPTQGDEVTIVDYAGTFGTNNVTVGRNGSNIDGTATDGTLATNRLNVRFVYIDSTQGWKAVFDKASGNYGELYVTATGGTVTESGDYKIHTFTGDGCFVVSCGGNDAGSNSVDYLVVAGGGGGGAQGGGGGGAGGFRASSATYTIGCAPSAPLVSCVAALPVSATTYPITVGGGGAISAVCAGGAGGTGSNGSNSVFSTITSAGGGGGGRSQNTTAPGNENGNTGGSGGGTGKNRFQTAAVGNTPPVSPPQGQPGGPVTYCTSTGAGGGGGAVVAGSSGHGPGTPAPLGGSQPQKAGPGGAGAGVPNAFGTSGENCGSYYYFSGGGGGGSDVDGQGATSPLVGVGGLGGGGGGARSPAAPNTNQGAAGTANTGGGGGGGEWQAATTGGGVGGKGIVIIRYKFQ